MKRKLQNLAGDAGARRRAFCVSLIGALALANVGASALASATLVSDSFSRTVNSGFGAAPNGVSYQEPSGQPAGDSVSSGTGHMRLTQSGTWLQELLQFPTSTQTDGVVRFSVSSLPTSGFVRMSIVARAQGSSSTSAAYRVGVNIAPGGATKLVGRMADGSAFGTDKTLPLVLQSGTVYDLRVQASGTAPTTLSATLWADTATEPSPQWSANNGTGPQQAGQFGLRFGSTAMTGLPLEATIESFTVTDPTAAASGPPAAPSSVTASDVGVASATITWPAVSGSVAGYEVSLNGQLLGSATQTTYALQGLTCGTSYTVSIATLSTTGTLSAGMATTSIQTQACPVFPALFSDDFTSLNTTNWTLYQATNNNQCCASMWAKTHDVVGNGVLSIQTNKDPAYSNSWVTGGIGLGKVLNFTYGKVEVRMRMDKGTGTKYCLLLWPQSGWPPEIDFAEDSPIDGSTRSTLTATLHYTSQNLQNYHQVTTDLSQWHTVGVVWLPDEIQYTLDGNVWATIYGPTVPSQPMHFAMQADTGKCTLACPGSTTPSNVNLQVDWIHIYSYR